MNYLIASTLVAFGMIGGHGFSRLLLTGNIDGQTNVPLGAVLGSAATVFLVGMWVSRKITRFEEQQTMNMKRLDMIEARLDHLTDRRRER